MPALFPVPEFRPPVTYGQARAQIDEGESRSVTANVFRIGPPRGICNRYQRPALIEFDRMGNDRSRLRR
jgi:hypothetical protein